MNFSFTSPTLYLRKDKKKKNGKMPLFIRFKRIDSIEPKFSFKYKGLAFEFAENEWDNERKLPIDHATCVLVEEEINRIKKEINKAILNDTEITIDLLRKIVENEVVDEFRNASFFDYFLKYLDVQDKKGKMSSGTHKSYMTTYRSLKAFKDNIKIKDINEDLINKFDKYLEKRGKDTDKGEVKGSRRNAKKHLRAIISHIQKRHKIEINNPFESGEISIEQYPTNDVFLTSDELKAMIKLYNDNNRKVVEDEEEENKKTEEEKKMPEKDYHALSMFLFACRTGLRLGDVLSLEWEHIKIKDDKELWMIQKTLGKKVGNKDVKLIAPIHGFASYIIERLQDDNSDPIDLSRFSSKRLVFPQMHPNDINECIRRCAKKANIDKHISFHAGRRTFATMLKLDGFKDYDIMKLMGHTNIATTYDYMKWTADIARKIVEGIDDKKPQKVVKPLSDYYPLEKIKPRDITDVLNRAREDEKAKSNKKKKK